METYVPLRLPPGLFHNGTKYQAQGRWYDGNLVRFHGGAVLPVGGWALNYKNDGSDLAVTGTPRGALDWRDNTGAAWLAVGTTGTPSKLYALQSGILTDITPAGLTNGNVDGSYQASGSAYGGGLYGVGIYGVASQSTVPVPPDTWSLDNFGQLPVFCLTSDGKLYSWDLNTGHVAAVVDASAPTSCRGVFVTNERFVFALGAGGDPRLVQWADQQSLTTWTPASTNQAGDYPLQGSGRLVAGKRTARENLIWTDTGLWSAVYIAGELIYSFQPRGDNCGLVGPHAVALAEGAAFWMGYGQFYAYDGAVQTLPCEVRDAVFGDLSSIQLAKVQAMAVPAFSEVWWFYPSADQSGTENDHYVTYNYREHHWSLGQVGRAAAVSAGVFTNPQAWTADGHLYSHEVGFDHGGAVPFLESGPVEFGLFNQGRMAITTGDRLLQVQKILSDEGTLGTMQGTLYTAVYPTDTETVTGPFTLTAPTSIRATGRQFRFRLDEAVVGPGIANGTVTAGGSTSAGNVALGSNWRVGTMRVGVVPMGYR